MRPYRRLRLPASATVALVLGSVPTQAQSDMTATCYATAGGALEICRSANEPEGVFDAPDPCRFGFDA